MNNVRSMMLAVIRSYSNQAKNMYGVKSKLKLAELSKNEVDLEEMEVEDMDEDVSDFMDVAQSYTQFTKEQKMEKLKLKQRIVARKYFKEVQPSFLTFIEKDQIRKLHEEDPKEWTPEKLSESFPALPDTIRKILRSNWVPTSIDRVMMYDQKVVENWKKFKTEELLVDPELRDHLMKFRNRKVYLTDRDVLAQQLVPPKAELPKPRSKYFISMAQGYIDNEQCDTKKLVSGTNNEPINQEQITVDTEHIRISEKVTPKERKNIDTPIVWTSNGENVNVDPQHIPTFNDFVKDKLEKLYEGSPEKAVGLLRDYEKYVKSLKSKTQNSNVTKDSTNTQSNLQNEPVDYDKDVNESDTLKQELVGNNASVNVESLHKLQATPETTLTKVDTYINKQHRDKERFTFTEFVKAKLESVSDSSPEEGTVLLHTYRQQMEQKNVENADINLLNDAVGMENKETAMAQMSATEETAVAVQDKNQGAVQSTKNSLANTLDTYIKEWKKSIETDFNYANRLRIPRSLYKMGMTYRVKDCYYDYDGEFLFRIPGVRS